MYDEPIKEPSRETSVRVQSDKDTARGEGSIDHVEPPWKVGDQLSDFVLQEFLGKGTSGFVYRALDQVTQRSCALKLLLPGTPEDLLRNKLGFRRMMSFRHPSLVRVHRIHQLGQYVALSMEEVVGETLTYAVRRLRGTNPDQAYDTLMRLTRQYAEGLAAMHINALVHRDIKPQNLMVDQDGNGRVIDYGLVGTFDPETDPNGYRHYLAGTPRYFSPEMLWNQYYLPAGDIFGLGMVMLEAMHAISPAGREETMVQRSETSPSDDEERINEAIEGLGKSVPDALREICLEMLHRDPSERPTAMRVARLGRSTSARVDWPQENPLVGRQREESVIRDWVDEIYAGGVGRLHLSGPSGIGKTRLIDEIEKYIRCMRWGQVFRARCGSRDDQPLQAFDQICDAIANRYKRGDREPIELDPVSTTILHTAFPALKRMVKCSMHLAPAGTTTERLDALEAAARMSYQLRRVGPLLLIIDDAQWADRDSLNVLDRLQSAVGDVGLGIITVSRDGDDRQRVPASRTLELKPLEVEDSVLMLGEAAKSWGVPVSREFLIELSKATEGNPFRLHELADEFGPGGALAQADSTIDSENRVDQLGQIDRLWQNRFERLSEEAQRVLSFVVTAGRRVSTQQLGALSGMGEGVDVAVSELVQQRLVSDEATGGECISVVHDRVAYGLTKTLDEETKRVAHRAWATFLVRQDEPEKVAARIAGHLFAAGEPGRAVSYAVLAAEDAERLVALTEAARWYALVVDHVDGREKIARLRQAARCYQQADHPAEAARCYQQLAGHVEADDRIECQLLAASMLIRSGQFAKFREQLNQLVTTLGLPRRKQPAASMISRSLRSIRLSLGWTTAGRALEVEPENEPWEDQEPAATPALADKQSATLREQQRLRLGVSLTPPMAMFDFLYAAELGTACALSAPQGSPARWRAIVRQAVHGCLDRGAKRTANEAKLLDIRPRVESLDHAETSGDLWAGVAYTHTLSCRWAQVPEATQLSVGRYRDSSSQSGFEFSLTRWMESWAYWNMGRWKSMCRLSDEMMDDATRRSDRFQRLISSNGLGGTAWLVRDQSKEWERIRREDVEILADRSFQMIHLMGWMSSMLQMVYDGRPAEAWKQWVVIQPQLRRLPYRRVQLIRVLGHSLSALTALHLLAEKPSRRWVTQSAASIGKLRGEQLPYATMLANLYHGLLQWQQSEEEGDGAARSARAYLQDAGRDAKSQRLLPFELAADDALARLDTGRTLGLLRERMQSRGVVQPASFERLYTLPDCH